MEHKKIFLIVASVVVITIILVFVVYIQKTTQVVQIAGQTATTTANTEPQKTDFGTKLPDDFPTDIPVEKGADIKQSYSLNYAGQKQLTIVFQSTKTVKENYALYEGYLKKQNWTVSNKFENIELSALYGVRENSIMNVIIDTNTQSVTAKSQVSVSVLKK